MTAITSAKSKLGFIGIGYTGRPIAQRLLESGFRLTAYDRHRTKAEELKRYGGTVAENVAELSSCDVVLSCLASDEYWKKECSEKVQFDLASASSGPAAGSRLSCPITQFLSP
jgi:3-hydroxyisobutyrate dehydrogenase-like beta-hydroxyacid dehydrogenase